MKPSEFEKMRSLEQTHWWFEGRRWLLRGLVKRVGFYEGMILDAGCGTGFAAQQLEAIGTVVGMDISREAFSVRERCGSWWCVARIENAPFRDECFDLVVALDLLEHLDDDLEALREVHRMCKPGGRLFLTVPAYQWLWGPHDEALGHRRRYSAAGIACAVTGAGFEIDYLSFTISAVFLPAMVFRLFRSKRRFRSLHSDLFALPKPVNLILSGLMRVETWLSWRFSLPFGLTIFVLAHRPPD